MFMAYVVLLGFSTPNAIVLGEYALYAVDITPNRWNVRVIAVATVSGLCYIHAKHPKLGLRLINILGMAKLLIIVVVVLSGIVGGLLGVGRDRELLMRRRLDVPLSDVTPRSTAQRNFTDVWAGSSTQPYGYATALLKVIYCFRGYSTANQVLSDVKNPVRTLKIAAPIALIIVSVAYLAINIAFFLVVDKDDFKSAGVVVAGVFFRNLFGTGAGSHILPIFIIISAAGNIAATSFAQARVNEELAKDGLLPFARFWRTPPGTGVEHNCDTKRPVPPPSKGLLLHWLISTLVIVLPPPGRMYNFLVDIGGYPVSVISVAVSVGLLYLRASPREHYTSPFRASTLAVDVFAASNCLLLILPWIPPRGGRSIDEGFAWYAYPATALGVLGCGAGWWAWWRFGGIGSRQREAGGAGGKLNTVDEGDGLLLGERDTEHAGTRGLESIHQR
jgi:amino acid transporter